MSFSIQSLVNKSFVNGKIVEVTKHLVVDENGEPVVSKFFDSAELAQAQIDSLGSLSEGLAFAKAQFHDQADKAQKGKAAIIAAYLDWVTAGRPVKEVAEPAPAAEPTAETTEAEPAPLPADEEF